MLKSKTSARMLTLAGATALILGATSSSQADDGHIERRRDRDRRGSLHDQHRPRRSRSAHMNRSLRTTRSDGHSDDRKVR